MLEATPVDAQPWHVGRTAAHRAAWQRGRNIAGAKIKWMFTTEAARVKLGRCYPNPPIVGQSGKHS